MTRDKKGRFARKGVLKTGLALGILMALIAVPFFHKDVMAMIDNMSFGVDEKYVAVTAEVKLDCTQPTHIYTEECLKRITDGVAISLSELVAQEKVVENEVKLLDEKRESFNQAVFNLQTVAN